MEINSNLRGHRYLALIDLTEKTLISSFSQFLITKHQTQQREL